MSNIPSPYPYELDPEYLKMIADYRPDMTDSKGVPVPYDLYERMVRHYVQEKAYRRRYRQTEKGKAARRKADRKRHLKRRMQEQEFRAWCKEQQRPQEGITPIRSLGPTAYERKKEYNRERARQLAAMKKQAVAHRIAVLKGAPEARPVREHRPPPDLPSSPADDETLGQLEITPMTEEEIQAMFETWRRTRDEIMSTVAAVRAQGLKVNPQTAPNLASYFRDRLRYLPFHLGPDASGRCARCGARLETPLGPRATLDDETEWSAHRARCEALEDIPDEVFWPNPRNTS